MPSFTRRHFYGLAAAGLAIALFIAACDSTTAPGSDDGMIVVNDAGSLLTVRLTDDPAELSQAWVEITGIYLQVGEHDPAEMGGMGDGDGIADRVWLLNESAGWMDLLTLADDWTTLVDAAEIPAGTYAQLRFIVGGAVIVTAGDADVFASSAADLESLNEYLDGEGMEPIDGPAGRLRCPSCGQTGFKVHFPMGGLVLDSGDNIVLIDFDVADTFGHPAGHSGAWNMHPTLRATDFAGAGSD